jgi:hypothetical protein
VDYNHYLRLSKLSNIIANYRKLSWEVFPVPSGEVYSTQNIHRFGEYWNVLECDTDYLKHKKWHSLQTSIIHIENDLIEDARMCVHILCLTPGHDSKNVNLTATYTSRPIFACLSTIQPIP